MALHSAAAAQDVPVSPTPPGLSALGTRCTSTRGASAMRSDGKLSKLLCCTRPWAIVISLPSAALSPNVTPPSSCARSEEHTSELQSRVDLVCRLLLEKKKKKKKQTKTKKT